MAKRPPPEPPLANGPNGERDERGRFRKGWSGGPGSAAHKYVQDRAQLYEAMREELPLEKMLVVFRQLLILTLNGDVRAAALLLAYRLGKPPEAMSPRELFPPARVSREPALSIEQIAEGLQALYEDYRAGRLSESEARTSRDLLASLLEARRAGDLERKFDELKLAMERNGDGQPS